MSGDHDHNDDDDERCGKCIHDHCGCYIMVNGRKGKLLRTKVMGFAKHKCAIVEWYDTEKREVKSFTDLKDATLEDCGWSLLTDEEKCHCKSD